ncbi:VOC family protein [Glycomyces sp. A-F 0318]|uniref:VOC family protein n=1 Tax=Glycomyces amatae TaxID=2881355 RepID=UPI001E31A191|nr:VOC family protein [Glycomyces amatae]MCD0442261.1 VOC family protein [Glycomyces amatae]
MPVPNQFIVYVSDAPAAARFYGDLFDMKPVFETPAFIAFDLAPGVQLALWSRAEVDLAATTVRTGELCLAVDGAPASVDALYESWTAKGVRVVAEPTDDVFGRTFVVADPDGNLIRVAPID